MEMDKMTEEQSEESEEYSKFEEESQTEEFVKMIHREIILLDGEDSEDEFSVEQYLRRKHEIWQRDMQVEEEMRMEREENERELQKRRKEQRALRMNETYMNEMLLKNGVDVLNERFPRTKWLDELNDDMDIVKDDRRVKEIGFRLMRPIMEFKCRSEDEFFNGPVDLCSLISEKIPQQLMDKIILPLDIPWEAQLMSPRVHYADTLFHMFRENIGPTIGVVADRKRLYCHSMLLGMISGYFHRRRTFSLMHLPPCIISLDDFVRAYRWMLEPLKNLNFRQLMELTRAANYLDINELHTQCWQLIFELLKSLDKIIAIYTVARKVCGLLEKQLRPHLGRIWLPFAGSAEYANLSYDKVYNLFKMYRLAVNTEIETLYSLCLWLDFDWEARQCHTLELIKLIHFDMMPFAFLITFNSHIGGSPVLNFLAQSNKVLKLIHKNLGKIYKNTDRYIGSINNYRRHWIYDSACKYHHTQECSRVRFVSYAEFIEYMEFLQTSGHPYGHRIKLATDPDIVCCKPQNAND